MRRIVNSNRFVKRFLLRTAPSLAFLFLGNQLHASENAAASADQPASWVSDAASNATHSNDCDCSASVCDCGAAVQCGGLWYAAADALFLQRDNSSQDQPIVLNGATGETLISAGGLDFDVEPGARFILGRRIGSRTAIEGGYFGFHEWSDSQTAVGNNDLRLPGDVALATFDFLDADRMRVDYDSEIHSAEANLVRDVGAFDLIAGFRYFQLDDDLNINSEDFQTGVSDYNVATRNSLYGGQLGARATRSWDWVQFRGTAKAGLFGADSEQRTSLADFDNAFVLRNSATSGSDAAFVGEINLDSIVPLTQNWSLRGGYNLIWVEGVALGPDQLDFTDTPTSGQALNMDGGAFFHGASAGLETRW